MEDKEFTKGRFIDLSKMAYERGVYTFSNFLTLAEISDFYDITGQLYVKYQLFGGYEGAERCMVGFGSQEELGYGMEFPIDCLKITPLMKKFAEELGHRDFLGSLMNLGIERSKIGDIVLKDNEAYIFVSQGMADVICNQLTRVRHTSVKVLRITDAGELPGTQLTETLVQVKSERIDAIIAKVFNLSRSQAAQLFAERLVFTDGRLMENESHLLKEGTIVSVRGHGRFRYDGVTGTSRKGSLYAKIGMY